jgi:hypothetical protein
LQDLGSREELVEMAKKMRMPPPAAVKKAMPYNNAQIISPPETEVIFNLSCEPAYKFSLPAFADYGLDPTQRTSNKLLHHALYLEANSKRYEISREPPTSGSKVETYRLAEVLEPFGKDSDFMRANTVPLLSPAIMVRQQLTS